ncbi:exosome non-catalytic core subunit rrp46 [Cadophora gregata]|uniref:exosome non-catalytic core subunit rrp46 n=1 Tax=Cadophora gregata TaxID=51156 RepID=UPI0026DD9658|nr:exosome non-catalytic core subunit rrp46 [Cadophora gregata]KAK0119214.1 exosome non-catalytic core subunit rrp46 [Cadophora gregata f. sp. sojae]KAK0126474.1 exosome non-catalytic core subunit rrp46 [Cadophora gregata]
MAPSADPTAILSHLHRTDGSATFSQNGYTVIGAVNGPLEIQRRDELPEEAAIDVIVRPAAGVGGTRERHLESILQSTLRQIILIHNFPRTLIQITLQITSTPENDTAGSKLLQASSNLPILPTLLQTAIMALLSASIPLSMTLTSTFLALTSGGASRSIVVNPTLVESQAANSVHVMAFTSHGDLLVAESEGDFTLKDWEAAHDAAKAICYDDPNISGVMADEGMGEKNESLKMFVKSTLEDKIENDLHWKD